MERKPLSGVWFWAVLLAIVVVVNIYALSHPSSSGGNVPGITSQCQHAGGVDYNCQP